MIKATLLILSSLVLTCGCGNDDPATELSELRAELATLKEAVESKDVELTEAKAELASARAKESEAETSLVYAKRFTGNNEAAPVTRPSLDWTLDDLFAAYFSGGTINQRLALVVDPDAAQPVMQSFYKGGVNRVHDYSIKSTQTSSDGRIVAVVEFPDRTESDYVIEKSPEHGYLINWIESHKGWESKKESDFRKAHGLVGAAIKVEVAYVKKSPFKIGFKITNQSGADLKSVTISVTLLGANDRYLTKGDYYTGNLKAGESVVEDRFFDILPESVETHQVRLEGVRLEGYQDVTKYFEVKQ